MSDSNPVTGQPYGGRDRKDDAGDDGPLPGETPTHETVGAPAKSDSGDENASRAATDAPMSSDADGIQPTEGIPEQVDAPSPADSTEGDPPGGSAANQSGRAPQQ